MLNTAGNPTLANCWFSSNISNYVGGAICNDSGGATLANCTFSANSADSMGGGIYGGSQPVTGCIFWGNSDGGGTDESAQIDAGTPDINYSCVQGWTGGLGGVGNMGLDPLLADPDGPDDVPGTADDDLHLLPGSPAINAGSNYVPQLPGEDFEGNPRLQNCRVDLGPYESPYVPASFADCNTNGVDDDCEVYNGTSQDCNENHLPDECESGGTSTDCNTNGVWDACDIWAGTSEDCNDNDVPDECEELDVLGLNSVLTHGAAGALSLEMGAEVDPRWVEPRLAGVRELVCQMNVPVDPATVTTSGVQVVCQINPYTGGIGLSLAEGALCGQSELTITFDPALPDEDCCQISLPGLATSYGKPSIAEFAIIALAGDADRDGAVTTADGSTTTQRLGWLTDAEMAQYDLDTDGFITTADTSVATQRLGRVAPSCP